MGAEPYWYIVEYEDDINQALQNLRQREFNAGRYNPAVDFIDFPLTDASPSPGAQHSSIEDALEASAEEGTRSILDIQGIAEEPNFCVAVPLIGDRLMEIYGTIQPTKEMASNNLDFLNDIERGHAIYFALYANGRPDKLLFAGYSFD